ncbi:hypothetical protein JOF56_009942 [Kibdelosporangium banguiense]|uniref:Lasso peptide biosynthesis PqqD family chaperone n=1 Tax=Kibdelosporangium banguiense TaxID=1365924 RepID=A0ABS4TYT5_9PSEU|nr:lasso peptide biosynthesis PqqD family chaperone [Kibdelosporangium banguiense]MBP2329557.1 hypothetical protein [Kibdelosporangium banguiense]
MAFTLRDNVSAVETDYGMVLLDEDSGDYWNLNPSGAVVLQALLDSGNLDAATIELAQQFAVDHATALEDARALLTALRSARLVTEHD